MKRLDKYLLREYAAPAFYCCAAFYMLFVVYSLFRDLPRFLEAQTPWRLAVRYYLCQVEYVVRFIVPASLFFAALYALWRLTRNNEITALRASGIGLHRVMLPFVAVGAAMSVLSLAINEAITPPAKQWAAEFLAGGFRPPPPPAPQLCKFYSSAMHREWTINRFDPRSPARLARVTVVQERPDGSRSRLYTADLAEWLDGQWWFHNAWVQDFDAKGDPLANPVRLGPPGYAVTEMKGFGETPADFVGQTKKWDFLTTVEMLRFLRVQPQISGELSRRVFQIHWRMAVPWSCLVVTLFGVPAGARGSRQNALVGLFAAMGLFASFYAVAQVGVYLGMRGLTWPWLGAWLANIVFTLAGAWAILETR